MRRQGQPVAQTSAMVMRYFQVMTLRSRTAVLKHAAVGLSTGVHAMVLTEGAVNAARRATGCTSAIAKLLGAESP